MEVMIMIRFDTKKDMEHYDNLYKEIYAKDKKIDQLTNNWNELEEWLKDTPMTIDRRFTVVRTDDILDKMKEIKNGGNYD